MSPASEAFSSSSRSMRSMKALSWSAATDSVATIGFLSSMTPPSFARFVRWLRRARDGRARQARLEPRGGVCDVDRGDSQCRLVLLEGGELFRARLALVTRLPVVVGHAVDVLAALIPRQRHTARVGRVLEPVREAVAAEAGEVHEVEVLHVGSRPQMLDQPAEGRRLELAARRLVDVVHERASAG